jgi:BirA family biotin operon repressor/biotin-[acetyl-CoA-carboxylase] ligase
VSIAADAPVLVLDEIDSTNAEALRRAAAGERGPLWLLGLMQTHGRGRRGRTWESPSGNLAATLLVTLPGKAGDLAGLSFAAALAVADAAETVLGPGRVGLKWPNDVRVDGAKLCGLLLESTAAGAGELTLAIGIGMNLAAAPTGLPYPAVSLAAASGAPPPTPQAMLAVLAPRLAHWANILLAEGFAPVRAAWLSRAEGVGSPVRVRIEEVEIVGVFAGLTMRGELELTLADGSRRLISAGDVFFSATET